MSADTATFRIDSRTLDYTLPDELIAQEPLAKRDEARLLVLHRDSGAIEHKRFKDLVYYLAPGDVVLINNAKVDRSRLYGRKASGGRVEVLFLGPTKEKRVWRVLTRPSLRHGTEISFAPRFDAEVAGQTPEGESLLRCDFDPRMAMERLGRVPLPPYIKRGPSDPRAEKDATDYQTVYAAEGGSVAAPTAGLHFTVEQLADLKRHGVILADLVLHVGWGTFRPIANDVDGHKMLTERFEIPAPTMRELLSARADRRRIVAVGTTVTRAIESVADDQKPQGFSGETSIFIRPGFQFRWAGALVTNLHVPRSTPIALTAAFAGLEKLERAYEAAIREKYRFYSYGDAMIVV